MARTNGSFFQLPDWVLGWWSTVGGEPPTSVATWSGAGGLEAIAFVSQVRARLHPKVPVTVSSLVNTGSGPGGADHLGFPAVEHRSGDVARWLASLRGGSLVLSNLAPPEATGQVPATARQVASSACPRLSLESGYQIGRSSSYRRQVRSKVRKVVGADVTFRLVGPDEITADVLEILIDLHERRWNDKDGASSFGRASLPLHRHLIAEAGVGRGPTAVVAEGPDGPIGIVYGFLWNETFSFYQSGWDPAWAALGLGTVIHAVAIEKLAESGCQVYDFLRGTEEYKYRFGATDLVDSSFLVPRGPGGLALRAKARLKERAHGDESPTEQ